MVSKVVQTVIKFDDVIGENEIIGAINTLMNEQQIDVLKLHQKIKTIGKFIDGKPDDVDYLKQLLNKTFVLETHIGRTQTNGIMINGMIDSSFNNICDYVSNTIVTPNHCELPDATFFSREECKLADCFYREYNDVVSARYAKDVYNSLLAYSSDAVAAIMGIHDSSQTIKLKYYNYRSIKVKNNYETFYLTPYHVIIIGLIDLLNNIRHLMDKITLLFNTHKNRNPK